MRSATLGHFLQYSFEYAPHTLQSAQVECEVLAFVNAKGEATTDEIEAALSHFSSGSVRAAIKRQSGDCLESVKAKKGKVWRLL